MQLLNTATYLLRACLSTLMQFCVRTPPKDDNSTNKIVFYKIIPLLDDWLAPLPPTPLMQELEKFKNQFKNCSKDLQLRFVYRMTWGFSQEQQLPFITHFSQLNPLMNAENIKLQPVYLCLYESQFLQTWFGQINAINSRSPDHIRYDYYMSRLLQLFQQMNSSQIYHLIVKLVQISLYSVVPSVKSIYDSLTTTLALDYQEMIYSTEVLSSVGKKFVIEVLTDQEQSLPIMQHVLLLHQQMEQQILLHLQQMKQQLNQQIKMTTKLEILIRHQLKYPV